MNIFDLVKEIKHGQHYSVPNDVYATAYTEVDGKEALRILTYLRNYWARQHITTEFEVGKPTEMSIWSQLECKHIRKNVTRISATNTEIKNFNPGK